jgi:hypothetical protein
MRRRSGSKTAFALAAFLPVGAMAHHGVAGLGAAGLNGPGAPVEATTSSVLPLGSTLLYAKLDHAKYERFDPGEPEGDYDQYWMIGLGRGFTPWFSGYLFVPYHVKVEDGGYNSRGFADISLFGQLGFKWDEGLQLTPETQSLDDLEDWQFSLFAGLTLPTGDANYRVNREDFDPGKATGFGKSSYSAGVTATRMLSERVTFNVEGSWVGFQTYRYDDDVRRRFGTERRINTALIYRAHTDPDRRLRIDLSAEAQYLHLGRDSEEGEGEEATGGKIGYLTPGMRLSWERLSLGLGVKFPLWTSLNEEREQQGAEGKEDFRLILTASMLF